MEVSFRKQVVKVRDRRGGGIVRVGGELFKKFSAYPYKNCMKKQIASNQFEILVTGESMWPVLVPGKRYMARRDAEPNLGDIVVAMNPSDPSQTIVKRVSGMTHPESPMTHYSLIGTVSWSSTFVVARPEILGVLML